jgi:methionyl-tRNA formyltransferase|tara:strand:- start:953 stop:1867 length:915 start_codon:yes stop_codon:yes gene_type:complete
MGMRIVFMGTPEFAVASLKALVASNQDVVGVITAPDRPQGRGKKVGVSAVKAFALLNELTVLQPDNLKDGSFINELLALKADLQIVVAFRMLPEIIWSMPKLGTFNLHASLLPQYRGAAPINWALINGEIETGITTFFLDKKIDTGKIILQEKEVIQEDDDFGTLYGKLMVKGAALILKTIALIENGQAAPLSQNDENQNPSAPKIFKKDCEINWDQEADRVYNFVRGMSPYPTAWCHLNHEILKIFHVNKMTTRNLASGKFESDGKNYLHFGTQTTDLAITSLQLQGKKRMTIEEFLRGYHMS